jgi:tRNA U34 5-carboxymethylaminomethyl modifying enzyme MnmG/GidA
MDEEITKILENHEKRVRELESLLKAESPRLQKRVSSKEFILKTNLQNDVQKTLAFGYYLEKYEGFQTFNTTDLETAFRDAKEGVPENINYKVIMNIKKGHIMEAKEKKDNLKAWNLTNSGEVFVETSLQQSRG